MKYYIVTHTGVAPSSSETRNDFRLIVCDWQQWLRNPQAALAEAGVSESELFPEEYLATGRREERINNTGIITLSPQAYFVTYCIHDDQGRDLFIPFIVTPNVFLLLNEEVIDIDQLDNWAKRGILDNPFDLAKVIGLRVLRKFQQDFESIESQMDRLEEEILSHPKPEQQRKVLNLHRQVIEIKRALNNHLSVFTRLAFTQQSHDENSWRDLLTDTERELENVRQLHELVEGLREAYQVSVDRRNNDIMKLLTLLATILLPINLLTSFFGMNFCNMPLINSPMGLPVFYGMSIGIVLLVFLYFRHKHWLY